MLARNRLKGIQRKRNIMWNPLHVEYKNKCYKWIPYLLQNRKRLTDLENEFMITRGEGWREGIVREFGTGMYILLYLTRITNKDLLYSTCNSAQCYVAAWILDRGEFVGKWIQYMYGWVPSLFTWKYHNIVISYTPIQNKTFKKERSHMMQWKSCVLQLRPDTAK